MCAFLVIFTLSAHIIVGISKVDLYLARDNFDFFSFMRLTFQSLAFTFLAEELIQYITILPLDHNGTWNWMT